MSDNKKLYTIIQINGELQGPKPADLKLLERELYIDDQGYLWFGDKNEIPQQINANKANEANVAMNVGNAESFFQYDNDRKEIFIGKNLGITQYTDLNEKSFIIMQGYGSTNGPIIDNFKINNSELKDISVKNLTNLTLRDDMWGTSLPTDNLEHGRVFFLVNE